MRKRILTALTMLSLFALMLSAFRTSVAHAAALMPFNAPQASPNALVGFDSKQFGTKQYAYIDMNGDIEELSLSVAANSQWLWNDITPANAPKAQQGTALAGIDSVVYGTKQYAYLGENDHIMELYKTVNALNWSVGDLTIDSSAPIAGIPSVLVGLDSPQFNTKSYAYIDSNGHVVELSIAKGGKWIYTDLTKSVGAPVAVSYGASLTAIDSPQFHAKQYAYIDATGRVYEIYKFTGAGQTWRLGHPFQDSGVSGHLARTDVSLNLLSGIDSPLFNSKSYSYIDANGDIDELSIGSGGQWIFTDLSASTPVRGVAGFGIGPAGINSPEFNSKQFAYLDENGDIEELYKLVGTGQNWRLGHLSFDAGDPTPNLSNPTSPNFRTLIGFNSTQFSTKQYAYIDQGGDIEELSVVGGAWHRTNLTAAAH